MDSRGNLLAESQSGPANLRLGLETVTQAIEACTHAALQAANLDHIPLHSLHAGLGLAEPCYLKIWHRRNPYAPVSPVAHW
ncbi:MAG: hypothetical protein R3E89_11715 [Thiolinea sp.]